MSKTPKTKVPVSDPMNVPVTFVSNVVASGQLNGVINVAFGLYRFTPGVDGNVEPDLAIGARLRMDVQCAEQLYEALGSILQKLKPANATTQ